MLAIGGIVFRLFFAVLGVCASAASAAQSQPAAPPSTVCLYESKSYTDGALICVYRSLMLTCALDGAKASWKPVTDKALASICPSASERARVVEATPRHRRHGIRHAPRINADASAKCFSFAGKRYCE